MSIGLIFEALVALLKFPAEFKSFLKFIQAAPAEKRQDMVKRIDEEFEKFEKTGRPTW